MLALIKALHLIAGTTLLGLSIASIYYIRSSLHIDDASILRYALKLSFIYDAIVFIAIVFQYISGFILSNLLIIPHGTPWLSIAYLALTAVTVCWLISVYIRLLNRRKSSTKQTFLFKKTLYIMHACIILLFILIIHDAATQSTYLGFIVKGW